MRIPRTHACTPAADQHLEASTKRTIMENEAMAAELDYHAAASGRLVAANEALRAEAAELRRQLEVAGKTGACSSEQQRCAV